MIKEKMAIVMCLLLAVIFSGPVVVTTGNALELGKRDQNNDFSAQDANYDSKVGWYLARSLIGGSSIFIGTIQDVAGPKLQPKLAEPTNPSFSRISVTVDEWLFGEPVQWKPQILLDRVPIVIRQGKSLAHRDEAWKNVNLEVGKQLLIAFFPPKSLEKTEALDKVDRYGLVVSNEALFPAIRATVINHARYENKPEDMLDAPALLEKQSDNVFSGYLVGYFWTKSGDENTDTEAAMISQLIGNRRIPEAHWRLLEGPLVRAMANDEWPPSEGIRNQVTDRLVGAGSSGNEVLARSALRILIMLSEGRKVDIQRFLIGDRRQKLIRNYRLLIPSGSVERGQEAFESQLDIRQ
jgi:hypothetical protein